MGFAIFIEENPTPIFKEWEHFARNLIPAASDMTPLALRGHIKQILAFIVDDMKKPQGDREQIEKSHGQGKQHPEGKPTAAETHAALRLAGGVNLGQMVSEFRALRASIIKLWLAYEEEERWSRQALHEMIRFNEAVDQATSEVVNHYAKTLATSKDLFAGILTHDLHNPVAAILGAAELIEIIGPLSDRQKTLSSQIQESAERVKEVGSNLLDITKARFGSGLPVVRCGMDMGYVARQIVGEMRTQYPDQTFNLEVAGETRGEWDKARVGQVLSNLIGNAVQYGFRDSPINIKIIGSVNEVAIFVQNDGVPLSAERAGRIFESLARGKNGAGEPEEGTRLNLGLGLYITREIVVAHDGEISVTSSEKDGTIFTACFPRKSITPLAENKSEAVASD